MKFRMQYCNIETAEEKSKADGVVRLCLASQVIITKDKTLFHYPICLGVGTGATSSQFHSI